MLDDVLVAGRGVQGRRLNIKKWFVLASFFLVGLLYLVIDQRLASLHAFWSSDCGARFAMVQNLVQHGSLVHMYYPFRDIDPTGDINPLAFYLFHQKNSFVPQYEPFFPLVCTLPYRVFGFFGLLIIPTISGLGCLIFLYKTAIRLNLKWAPIIPLAVGIGTPVLVYSVLFWDHSLMMLVVAAAAYFLLCGIQSSNRRYFAAVGAILGLGVFCHELVLGVLVAVVLAALPFVRTRADRLNFVSLIAGYIPIGLLWLISNRLIYGNFAGPHLSANMGGNTADHHFSVALILSLPQFLSRAHQQLSGITSTGVPMTEQHLDLMNIFLIFDSLLALSIAVCFILGIRNKLAALLWAAAGLVAFNLVRSAGTANGLFEATPLFIPAAGIFWLAKPNGKSTEKSTDVNLNEREYYALLSRATWIYIFLSIADPILPGVDWGSRYLLPVLPFLVILSAYALEAQFNAPGKLSKAVAVSCAIALLSVSIYCQSVGIAVIRHAMKINSAVNRRIAGLMTPVIVYADAGIGSQVTASSVKGAQSLIRTDADWDKFLALACEHHYSYFDFVGTAVDCVGFQSHPIPTNMDIYAVRCTKQTDTHLFSPGCPDLECYTFAFARLSDLKNRKNIGQRAQL